MAVAASVRLIFINLWPPGGVVLEGAPITIHLRDTSPFGILFPSLLRYRLFIQDASGATVWIQSDMFDLASYSKFDFILPEQLATFLLSRRGMISQR
jgi:hypothetical protein